MFKILEGWYHRYFSNEEAVALLLLISFSFAIIYLFGQSLAPVFTALIIAYLMQGMVTTLIKKGAPELVSVLLVYTFFLSCLATLIAVVLPLIWGQLVDLVDDKIPQIINQGHALLHKLPEQYPHVITVAETDDWIKNIKGTVTTLGEDILSFSVSKLPNLMAILIFLVLVPVLVFFFLKDRRALTAHFIQFLPNERAILSKVWNEMDQQISNYVRGKTVEILIVGIVTYVTLFILGVDYAELLSALVGLSVVIPYIGAAAVTIPVALVAYFQFGFTSEFATVLVIYGIIQALDGNVLVPLLFSEVVNLHPVVIIIAVLIFGGLWGLWGVFFAIPLATLVKAVVSAWPTAEHMAAKNTAVESIESE